MGGNPEILFWLLFIPHMLFSLSIHEASHAGSAYLLGDDTAALAGRVTLNPLHHIDPFGLVAFFIIHFGWAKPTPVNPLRFKHPRRDDMLVSFAGPGSNLLIGVLLLAAMRLVYVTMGDSGENVRTALAFLLVGAQLNVGLAFFNLIPIPPLDGSHILIGLLPGKWAMKVEPFMNYGWLVLLGLIILSEFASINLFGLFIGTPIEWVMRGVAGDQCLGSLMHWAQAYRFFF